MVLWQAPVCSKSCNRPTSEKEAPAALHKKKITMQQQQQLKNLDLTYALGGEREDAPLVKRTLAFPYDPSRELQPQLIERSDALIADIWAVQDAHLAVLDDSSAGLETKGLALDTVLACLHMVVTRLLHPVPGPHHLQALARIQNMCDRLSVIIRMFQSIGPDIGFRVMTALHEMWTQLQDYNTAGASAGAGAGAGTGDGGAEESADADADADADDSAEDLP